jgi:hypothetical protein
MTPVAFKIEGIDEVIRTLGRIEGNRVVARAVDEMTKDGQALMAAYPPEGDYNRPGAYPKRWYQRHVGSRWATRSGGIGGRNSSQKLQKSWRRRMQGQGGVVWTEVTYAAWVQSKEHQTAFHRDHGWRTDEQVRDEYAPLAVERLQQHIREALNG